MHDYPANPLRFAVVLIEGQFLPNMQKQEQRHRQAEGEPEHIERGEQGVFAEGAEGENKVRTEHKKRVSGCQGFRLSRFQVSKVSGFRLASRLSFPGMDF